MSATDTGDCMTHYLITLTGENGQQAYEALRQGDSESVPAPAACSKRFLAQMRPDRQVAAEDRPMALLYVQGLGITATCQLYTTFDENYAAVAKRRTIQLRRASVEPLSRAVTTEELPTPRGSKVNNWESALERGVLQVDAEFYNSVLQRARDARPASSDVRERLSAPAKRHRGAHLHSVASAGAANAAMVSHAEASLVAQPVEGGQHKPPNIIRPQDSAVGSEHPQPYGRRRAGQYAREQYLELVSRHGSAPRTLLGLGQASESDEDLARRINRLDEAEQRYGAGARAEERVGHVLEGLGRGFYVFHDLQIPDRYGRVRSNVDHVVISPGGVFAVETKSCGGTTLVCTTPTSDRPARTEPLYWQADIKLAEALEQARKEASFVEDALGLRHGHVEPILCIDRGFITGGGIVEGDHWRSPVTVIAPGNITDHIHQRPRAFPDSRARQMADVLAESERS